jgi:glycosyltransferase involved in cell wall biosynthesis
MNCKIYSTKSDEKKNITSVNLHVCHSKDKLEGGRRLKGFIAKPNLHAQLITIVTVVFNGEKFLENTIQSVMSQTYESIEYIIVDGGSSDDTLNIVKKYDDLIEYWVSEKDRGIYDAMNKAIDLSSGELIYFLNAGDSLYEVNTVEKIAKIYEHDISVYGNVLFTQSQKVYGGKFSKLKLLHKNICHQSIFYNNHFLRKNKFDLHYSTLADYAINIKLFGGKAAKYEDIIIANYDQNGKSSRNLDLLFIKEKKILIKDNFGWLYYLTYIILRKLNNLRIF